MYCSTGMQARSASCRGPYGSTGMQGGLRRGAYGTVLLGKVCYGRVWCIGEGMQEGHALIHNATYRCDMIQAWSLYIMAAWLLSA